MIMICTGSLSNWSVDSINMNFFVLFFWPKEFLGYPWNFLYPALSILKVLRFFWHKTYKYSQDAKMVFQSSMVIAYFFHIFQLQDTKFICKRKGGSLHKNLSHDNWCQTVYFEPDVISMSLIPISSLLSGINGSGFLSHAINLYLRCKHDPSFVSAQANAFYYMVMTIDLLSKC